MRELWTVELLGGLRVRYGDRAWLSVPPGKPGALLARLALSHSGATRSPRPVPREELIELLWPEGEPEMGRHNLRVTLYALRRLLATAGAPATDWLRADRAAVTLTPAQFTTDVADFHTALAAVAPAGTPAARGEALARAVDLYRGELLPGFFEPWVLREREHLAATYLEALRELTQAREESGDLAGALTAAQHAVKADPLREEAHYDLMRLYAATGQPAACLRQYEELEQRLREELDETPSAEARALAEELREQARTLIITRRPVMGRGEGGSGRGDERATGGRGDDRAATMRERERREHEHEHEHAGPAAGSPPRPLTPSPPRPVLPSPPPPVSPSPRLPTQLNRFFGREAEIARLTALLSSSVTRLVTITGPGGSGKTRLAVAVAGRLQESFGDAAALVPLADLADPGRIVETIAGTLGLLQPPDADPWAQLLACLQARPWLLVLDNFEHLVAAAPPEAEGAPLIVRTLLEQVPTLACLVTSRRPLGLSGEQEFALLPLPTPRSGNSGFWILDFGLATKSKTPEDRRSLSDPIQNPKSKIQNPKALMQFPSVQLFVDRARAARADFALTEANAAAVAELCDRLDGLPLALELAAARAAVLSPKQMLAQLEQRFAFLVGHRRDTPARHRTLRAAVESSYLLLPPALQRFFARLSVFRGGWTLEAAAAVCSDFGLGILDFGLAANSATPTPLAPSDPIQNPKSPIENAEALDLLEHLRECSLIFTGATRPELVCPDSLSRSVLPELRYRMLETLREFGWEQLQAFGEAAAIQRRHREWFLQLAERAEARVTPPEQQQWLARLEANLDNFRAALIGYQEAVKTTRSRADAEAGLRLAGCLVWFWTCRGYLAEGLEWLEGALAQSTDVSAPARARALLRAAEMAGTWHGERCTAFRRAARGEYEKILAGARQADEPGAIAEALAELASLALELDDREAAWQYAVEARQHLQALNAPHRLARVLEVMARITLERQDRPAARALLEERLALGRESAAPSLLIHALGAMGHFLRDEGDLAGARALYRASLELRRESGDLFALAQSLEDLAVLAGRQGQAERAIRLLGAGEAFCQRLGTQPPVAIAAAYERTVAEARASLGDAEFAAAWAQGRAMSLDGAVEYALGGE